MTHRTTAASIALLFVIACSASEPEAVSSDGSWVGSIETEGGVTTVINESGSVWGGTARLVEEASIGVETGEDPYLLGRVVGIAAHDDRIYVLDQQVPTLRVYDFDGRHLMDVGRPGAGPGEFTRPSGVAVAPDGRIFVRDTPQGRINVYGPDGEPTDSFPIASNFGTDEPMAVTLEGTVYTQVRVEQDSGRRRIGMQGFRPDGSTTEVVAGPAFDYERPEAIVRRGPAWGRFPVPFTPSPTWRLASSGAVVGGVGDEYRYEVRHPDGTRMVVRRRIPRVPLPPDQVEARADSFRERIREAASAGATVEGADASAIPDHKPAFENLFVDRQGRVWIVREGPSEYLPNCGGGPEDDPCWRSPRLVDLFDVDGRFLGEVDVPAGAVLHSRSHIDGDVVIASYRDDAGTPMVKRYRLVAPGGR